MRLVSFINFRVLSPTTQRQHIQTADHPLEEDVRRYRNADRHESVLNYGELSALIRSTCPNAIPHCQMQRNLYARVERRGFGGCFCFFGSLRCLSRLPIMSLRSHSVVSHRSVPQARSILAIDALRRGYRELA